MGVPTQPGRPLFFVVVIHVVVDRLDAPIRVVDQALPDLLLDAALVRRAVVQALESQGEPAIQELKAAAKAEGIGESILDVLEERGIAVSSAQREEILGCTDIDRSKRRLRRAAVATSADEVLAVG